MSQPFDTKQWRLRIISASPYFRGVPLAQLEPLAEQMRLVEWPREHIFAESTLCNLSGLCPPEERPLSLVASGKVALIQRYSVAGSRRLLGPGEMFGLDSVFSWLYPKLQGSPQFIANTVDSTWCLELPQPDFAAVLGTNPGVEPLRSVLNAWALAVSFPIASESLSRSQPLSFLRQDQIQALLARSTVISIGPGQPLPGISKGEVPTAAYVLLSGQLDRISQPIDPLAPPLEKFSVGRLLVGQVIGLPELFSAQEMPYSVVSRDAQVLCITKAVFDDVPRQIPGYLRAVAQASGAVPLYAALLSTPLGYLLSSTITAVVPTMTGLDAELSKATELLASYIATEFEEDVLLVRVLPNPPSVIEPAMAWEADEGLPVGAVREVEVALADFNLNWLLSWVRACWDVVIIDPIALGQVATPNSPFLDALMALDAPIASSLLLERPSSWDGVAGWMPQKLLTWTIPTAVLANNDGLGLPPSWTQSSASGFIESLVQKAATMVDGALTLIQQKYQEEAAQLGPERVSDGICWPTWPVATARFLLPESVLKTINTSPLDPAILKGIGRWARAITRRRVGVAIGGAAALSYIGSAMLQGLEEREIPVDLVSGTSFGTVVGAFYTVNGISGLKRLETSWPSFYFSLLYSAWTTFPLALWADLHLNFADLNDLPIALFPVATLASNEHEWPIRGGTVGNGVRSSGSLPPFAPTIHGRLRLIDGGYSADVPCQVLSDEGADIIIAVNPYTYPPPMPGVFPWIPFISSTIEELNPLLRTLDWTRGYQMLWRFAAISQLAYADVVYASDNPYTPALAFFAGDLIVASASKSEALKVALAQAEAAWDDLLGEPHAHLSTTVSASQVTLPVPIQFNRQLSFSGTAPAVEPVLTEESVTMLEKAARTLLESNPVNGPLMIKIQATGEATLAQNLLAAQEQGQRVKQLLIYAGLPESLIQIQAAAGPTQGVTLELHLP